MFFSLAHLSLSLFQPQPLPFPCSCLPEPPTTGPPLKVTSVPTLMHMTMLSVNGPAKDTLTTMTTPMIMDTTLAQIPTMRRSTPPFCKSCHLENDRVKGVSTWTLRGPVQISDRGSMQPVTRSPRHSSGLPKDTENCKSSHLI
jgi:hypothetical protein